MSMRLSVRLCTELIFNLSFLIHRYLNDSIDLLCISIVIISMIALKILLFENLYSHFKVIIGCLSPHSEGACNHYYFIYLIYVSFCCIIKTTSTAWIILINYSFLKLAGSLKSKNIIPLNLEILSHNICHVSAMLL